VGGEKERSFFRARERERERRRREAFVSRRERVKKCLSS
jgi:hypothetical protein